MKSLRTLIGRVFSGQRSHPLEPAPALIPDDVRRELKTKAPRQKSGRPKGAGDGMHTRKSRDPRPPAVKEALRSVQKSINAVSVPRVTLDGPTNFEVGETWTFTDPHVEETSE